MFNNVNIKGVATYHLKYKVENKEFITHFKQYGQDEHLKHLMSKVGRKVRTHIEAIFCSVGAGYVMGAMLYKW